MIPALGAGGPLPEHSIDPPRQLNIHRRQHVHTQCAPFASTELVSSLLSVNSDLYDSEKYTYNIQKLLLNKISH
jgi:hypothetical protein